MYPKNHGISKQVVNGDQKKPCEKHIEKKPSFLEGPSWFLGYVIFDPKGFHPHSVVPSTLFFANEMRFVDNRHSLFFSSGGNGEKFWEFIGSMYTNVYLDLVDFYIWYTNVGKYTILYESYGYETNPNSFTKKYWSRDSYPQTITHASIFSHQGGIILQLRVTCFNKSLEML